MAHKNSSKGLSVVIITHNEEDNIRKCLESVQWADEVIVVDSDSTDKTEGICRTFGVHFVKEPWKGFALQKNSAIEKATRDWILSLDADERITPELKKEIISVLESAHPKDGYFIARKNFFLGRWIKRCGWYPDYNLRLFQKGKGLFGIREVHEAVKLNGVAGHLEFPMEHHTYKSLEDFMKRLDRYSTLAAQELLKEKKTYGILHIVFRPFYTFISMYLLRLGLLEGYYGFVLSVLYAFYTFLKYIKLRELQRA
ncbi:MAG TPA: glycosyltransferase family 2 protein [Smithella sp.]|nr:glycosyltransferase family 2 protein [Smithella sp.]